MRLIFILPGLLMALSLTACDVGPNSGRGFSLPEGDISSGRATFLELQCNACHSIDTIERLAATEYPAINVRLGGPVTAIKTYGDLVTSVINPSHKITRRYGSERVETESGESRMTNYNDVMTVQQLVDLVTFLETNYTLIRYDRTVYPIYRAGF